MAIYSFKITKGKYQLNLTTTDKELVNEQFEKWVKQASDYAKKHKVRECKNIIDTQIKAEEEVTRKNIEKQLAKVSQDCPPPIEDEHPVAKDRKEEVQDNLDIFYAPPVKETVNEKVEKNGGVFDNILEKSLNNPQTELKFKSSPTIKKDNAFLNFITSRKIEKKIDYLLLTAYYFTQYEQKPRFTLKQLNAKLMQNIAVILDHSVLQEAMNRDYIECLPDLTGLVGASEYRLTAYGEKVLLDD
jgi:hypothetical protein